MSKTIKKRAITLSKVMAAFIFIALLLNWLKLQSPSKNHYISISTLLRELNKIPPPLNTYLIGESQNHKVSSAIVSARYKTELSTAKIFDHYNASLENSGWSQSNTNNILIHEYCKGSLNASIEFIPKMPIYSFTITWRQSKSASECND